jgi:hypothetical protein
MLMQMKKPTEAFHVYEASLRNTPLRFNGVYGAYTAAKQSGNILQAKAYSNKLVEIAQSANSNRPEIALVRRFLKG